MAQVQELVEFLGAGARVDVRATALEVVLGLTAAPVRSMRIGYLSLPAFLFIVAVSV